MIKFLPAVIFFSFLLSSCSSSKKTLKTNSDSTAESIKTFPVRSATKRAKTFTTLLKIDRKDFVAYSKKFLGTPYKYGSAIPENGLDCSGFITVVF